MAVQHVVCSCFQQGHHIETGFSIEVLTFFIKWDFIGMKDAEKSREQFIQELSEMRESEEKFRILSEQSMMGIIIAQDDVFKYVNQAASNIFEYSAEEILNWKQGEYEKLIHSDDKDFVMKQAAKKQAGKKDIVINYEWRLISKTGRTKWVETYSKTVSFMGRSADMVTMIDITKRKHEEEQKEKLISELQEALDRVKILSGLLPICSYCKKVRDDEGYWHQVEEYFQAHSEADFSHSLCPGCAKKFYPESF